MVGKFCPGKEEELPDKCLRWLLRSQQSVSQAWHKIHMAIEDKEKQLSTHLLESIVTQ